MVGPTMFPWEKGIKLLQRIIYLKRKGQFGRILIILKCTLSYKLVNGCSLFIEFINIDVQLSNIILS
jgi:hypothetical protein